MSPEVLIEGERALSPSGFTPDGSGLLYDRVEEDPTRRDVWWLPSSGKREPRLLLGGPFAKGDAVVSPDGRWVAFESPLSGRNETYLQPFPGPGPRQTVSIGGGESPLWARDGRELYYTTRDRLMAVSIPATDELSIGAPELVFEGRYRDDVNANTPYDVTPDGRFLRVQQVEPDRPLTHIELVLGWNAELEPKAR